MGRTTNRPPLKLTTEEIDLLRQNSNSRTLPKQEVQRSKILLLYHQRVDISEIKRQVGLSRPSIYKCIDKALAGGIKVGLADKYHRPKEPVITDESKLWVINLACTKPKDHGYAAELWSHSLLADHIREHAARSGHECLSKAVKATVHRILKSHPIQPHKMKYYLEKRDPEFDKKMEDVLIVYKEVNLQNDKGGETEVITISVDEKPGVQAIKNIAPDLPPNQAKAKHGQGIMNIKGWERFLF